MSEFRMPSLGADMEAGTLVEWLVQPGSAIKRGDIIAVVETQKGAIEIEVFEDGILDRVLVDVGARVPVGTPLASIASAGQPWEQPGKPAEAPATAAAPWPPPEPPHMQPRPVGERPARGQGRASPAARRLAEQAHLDISIMRGSGPEGAVVLADVEAALRRAPVKKRRVEGLGLSQMRAAIATAMSHSKREIPHYYLAHTIDVMDARDWVEAINSTRPPERRLLMGALFVKATALAARAYPEFNGFYEERQFRKSAAIHVGVAIAIRGGGLVAPALHDAADLDLETLMTRLQDLTSRVRAGRFRSSEIADPTITVSSLGDRGVETLYGIIYPPQVAIVGFGKVVERPWIRSGAVLPRATATVTLAADHRVSDGHRGSLFLSEIERFLKQPGSL
jgi:pyruvate dehydrogenase E2 component (dihydrolipoamide acetyltransferase)